MKRLSLSVAFGLLYAATSFVPVFAQTQTNFSASADLKTYFTDEQLGSIPATAQAALLKEIQLQPNEVSLNALVMYVKGYLNDRLMHIADAIAAGDFALAAKLKSDPINCYVMTQIYQYKKWGVVLKNTQEFSKSQSAAIYAKIAQMRAMAGMMH